MNHVVLIYEDETFETRMQTKSNAPMARLYFGRIGSDYRVGGTAVSDRFAALF